MAVDLVGNAVPAKRILCVDSSVLELLLSSCDHTTTMSNSGGQLLPVPLPSV